MGDTKIRLPKATTLLQDDHQKVKKLFASYEQLKNDEDLEGDREELFEEIKTELTIHSQIEEEIFYPAVAMAEDEDAKKLVQEALEEHQHVKTLLEEIDALDSDDPTECDARMNALKESVLHHAEEEEKDIFPIFEDLDRDLKVKVAEQLVSRKRELETEGMENADETGAPEDDE